MRWNKHSEFQDKHAVLSASKYHWLNYPDEKLFEYVDNLGMARRGTKQHALAKLALELGQKMPNTSQTLNLYVNDCIGYRMDPEVMLFYSPWAFGTVDAISFRRDPDTDRMVLRIFDLKNGRTKASITQLLVYAAYFCLEYLDRSTKVNDIEFDLRIYQHDQIYTVETDPVEIMEIMERTKYLSDLVTKRMEEEV